MRGINTGKPQQDRKIFDAFTAAISQFPIGPAKDPVLAQRNFSAAFDELKKLTRIEPVFPRAFGWLGYACVVAYSEGWTLPKPEAAMSTKELLNHAITLATKAQHADPTDYDVWWALANCYLHRAGHSQKWPEEDTGAERKMDFFQLCEGAFREAIFLNRDEGNLNLLAEAADAFTHMGNFEESRRLARASGRIPDWHLWISAWTFFVKSRKFEPGSEDFRFMLTMSLDEMRSVPREPEEQAYLTDMQLLRAAVHANMAKHFSLAGDEAASAKQLRRAGKALLKFQAKFPDWTVSNADRFAPFMDQADRQYWLESVALAGLPES